MKRERGKYDEVLGLVEKFKETRLEKDEPKRYRYVLSTLSPRFWGREDALKALQEVLSPEKKSHRLRTLALYGMGGVGKTQIALQYANRYRESYNTIL